jgi:peptidoglycan/LPS O-acetylase OafA/YrhL
MSGDPDPATRQRLRWVRLGALAAGSAALVLAMLAFPESARARDMAWTVGVALLILSVVANHLIPRGR